MNRDQEHNQFKETLKTLIEEMERATSTDGVDAYARAGEGRILEHTTRRFFLDKVMQALGWSLGRAGSMAEEARIKGETTTYMDYVGVNPDTRAPMLIVEAKRWDAPFISRRSADTNSADTTEDIVVQALTHLRAGKTPESSPVTDLWYGYLSQVSDYVRSLRDAYDHEVKRVLLTSGKWMLVFLSPVRTFLGDGLIDESQFAIIKKTRYVERSSEILDMLGQKSIAERMLTVIRPAQVSNYICRDDIAKNFFGLVVCHEKSGAAWIGPRPRVLVYPAIIVSTKDSALLILIRKGQQSEGIVLRHNTANDMKVIDDHIDSVMAEATALLHDCEKELDAQLALSPLREFQGFPVGGEASGASDRPRLMYILNESPNQWMLLVGDQTHYLLRTPIIGNCRFHEWNACRAVGHAIGDSALGMPSIATPRAFFTDSQAHHCAHQQVFDRRTRRCVILAIDERVCCQACVYLDSCWSAAEKDTLPCGA